MPSYGLSENDDDSMLLANALATIALAEAESSMTIQADTVMPVCHVRDMADACIKLSTLAACEEQAEAGHLLLHKSRGRYTAVCIMSSSNVGSFSLELHENARAAIIPMLCRRMKRIAVVLVVDSSINLWRRMCWPFMAMASYESSIANAVWHNYHDDSVPSVECGECRLMRAVLSRANQLSGLMAYQSDMQVDTSSAMAIDIESVAVDQ